jgi:hypothetical protein
MIKQLMKLESMEIVSKSRFSKQLGRVQTGETEKLESQLQNRPVQVASTAWQRVGGGYTSAGAPRVVESAAAITRQTNMPQSTTRAPAILLSRASSKGRIGSTITAQEIPLPGLSYQIPTPTPTPWTNPCLDQLDGYPWNGNRSSTNKARVAYKRGLSVMLFMVFR